MAALTTETERPIEKPLPRSALVRSLVRTFLLQASWNFDRMQNLGTLYVLAPVLRVLYREQGLAAAYWRHLEYFNTHPFLASPVFGTLIALEQKRSRGEDGGPKVEDFKAMVMAPYAAMGDALFWGGIRPLAAGVALFFAFRGSLWAPVAFLLCFNLPHLWFRIYGFWGGWRMGVGNVERLKRGRLPDLAIRCKEAAVVLLGVLSAFLVATCLRQEELPVYWGVAAAPLVVLAARLAGRGVSSLFLVMSVAGLILAGHLLL